MRSSRDQSLEEVRGVLFGGERAEISDLRDEVGRLQERVIQLESLLLEQAHRAETVGSVLPSAFGEAQSAHEELAVAMKPTAVRAIHHSARDESEELAIALYPVLGPAVRKMLANLLSFGPPDGGTFAVEQVLLIERESGLLLAATTIDGQAEDSDVISGMLDAIRMFVQDAFNTPEHDGLQDLRVGNISVLVEWGPRAVLASVVRGVPDDSYRIRAAELLEQLHRDFEGELSASLGISASLDQAVPMLHDLRTSNEPKRARTFWIGMVAAVVLLALLVVVIIL